MPDILLATKIHIPSVRGNLVSRPRLIQRLNDVLAQNHRLTLISAPAGYGKSTLLSAWASQVDTPLAWLSLEDSENLPQRFWSYFAAALSSLPDLRQAGVGEDLRLVLQSPALPPVETLLAGLLNELDGLTTRAILVLDDLHVISETQIHHGLIYLLDHLPPSARCLHLVVASRMDPPWPLARWRARRELTDLRTADLRFSPEEALQFLGQTLPLELSVDNISKLQGRTEGWIAGLQMAAVSMQARLSAHGEPAVSSFIETFAGTNRFIVDYLMEEVISQQPPERRDFLQATSILDQFTAPLCDALLDRHDSQAMLEQVEQANLFLVPLDEQRQWYRYHHLFAELLRKSLKQTQPEHTILLHQRASQWYAQNNLLAEAISHALEADDVVLVNRFVSGNALALVEHTELMEVLRHFEHMPEEQICARPWLCVAYVWVKAYVDPSGSLDILLQKAMQSISEVENAAERQRLSSQLDAVWAYIAWVKGRADLALEFVRTALSNIPEDDWLTRTHLLNIEGLCLQYLGKVSAAIHSFEAAVAAGQRSGRPHASFNSYTNWAFAAYIQGQLHQAYALCQQVLILADQAGFHSKGLPVLAYAYATMSTVEGEWNHVDSALALAQQSVSLAEQWRHADTLHYGLTCLAEALWAAGNLEAAFTVNRRAIQLAISVSPWFHRISIFYQVLLELTKGDLTAAVHWFTKLENLLDDPSTPGMFSVVQASLYNAQGRHADVNALVEQCIAPLEQHGDWWILLKLLPVQALALQALGQEEEALEVLERCLALAASEGYVRIFISQGAPMRRLLQIAAGRGIHTEYVQRLLAAFPINESVQPLEPKTARPSDQHLMLIEPLSKRELEVLRLLDSTLTSEEIAQELYISTNTARTHIRNVYSKLDAHGRLQAIQKAKELGLI